MGILVSRKSFYLPWVEFHSPVLTEEDMENFRRVKEFGVTGIMQPFVCGKNLVYLNRNGSFFKSIHKDRKSRRC